MINNTSICNTKNLVYSQKGLIVNQETGYVYLSDTEYKNWRRDKKFLINIVSRIIDKNPVHMESKDGKEWLHKTLALTIIDDSDFAQWYKSKVKEGLIYSPRTYLNRENKKLAKNVAQYQRRHTYYKFQHGTVLYVASDKSCSCSKKFKIGITDDINKRLSMYRTTIPAISLKMCVFTPDHKLLEQCILRRYHFERDPHFNHEWIFEIEFEELKTFILTIIDTLRLPHRIMCEELFSKYDETCLS